MTWGVDFPLRLDDRGSAAAAPSLAVAAEQLIEQLLFTSYGERLNEPELGCGLLELVFDPATDDLRAATQFQVQAQLQRWLGDVVRIMSVALSGARAELAVTVTYALPPDTTPRVAVFTP